LDRTKTARAARALARRACEAALEFLLAADCLVCLDPLPWRQRGGVCLPCWDRLPWDPGSRPIAGLPVVLHWGAAYRGVFRDLIHHLKFAGLDPLARPIGEILADRVGPRLPPVDLVTFVPLHPWRRFRRGFNQAEILARALARRFGLPCAAILVRHRVGRRQVGLGRRDRLTALRGCYRLRRAGRQVARGRRILLVDDVITTGATMEACARLILAAGAAAVCGCAVARTPEDPTAADRPAAGPDRPAAASGKRQETPAGDPRQRLSLRRKRFRSICARWA
jgi:ComF family protein